MADDAAHQRYAGLRVTLVGGKLPAWRSAVVTREDSYVVEASGRPGTVDTSLTSMPVSASMVSTSPPCPPNTSGPAVIVNVALPLVVESVTLTAEMVDSRRRTPARTCELPSPADSASVLNVHTTLSKCCWTACGLYGFGAALPPFCRMIAWAAACSLSHSACCPAGSRPTSGS